MTSPDPEREEQLFTAALKFPKEHRAAFLDSVCGEDPALRGRLEVLLAMHDQEDALPELVDSKLPPQPDADTIGEMAGTRIDRYKLLEKIGEGGCGIVYVAEQVEPMRRRVALKLIKLGMDTKKVVARFEAERQALALMDHPNIARVLDAGTTDSGRPYFVMELVRGRKITDHCDRHRLSTGQRLELFIQVCQAVQHAHQKGIIHRDLKPSNVLVTLHDGRPVPKVIDFGVAKAVGDQTLTDKTVYTALEQFIGTPAYMSPEQAEMSGLDIDTRTDIYSLGVLLYELLTGRTPFEPKTLLKSGLDQMRKIIREQEPPRPSGCLSTLDEITLTHLAEARQSDQVRLVRAIRGDLDWIAMKCLEKDRSRRYETVSGLAQDISRHLRGEPIFARAPSAAYRIQKLVQKNKLAFAAGTMIVTALVGGAIVSGWQALRAVRAEQLASQRLVESEQSRLDAEAISAFLSEAFQSPDPQRDGRTVTVAELLDRAAADLAEEFPDQPDRQARLRESLAGTYHSLGLSREAYALQELAIVHYRRAHGADHDVTVKAVGKLTLYYYDAGEMQLAGQVQEALLESLQRRGGRESPKTLDAMSGLAHIWSLENRSADAARLRREVLDITRSTMGFHNPMTLHAMINLGWVYWRIPEKRQEGLALLEEALSLSRSHHPENYHLIRHALSSLTDYHAKVRELPQAIDYQNELVRLTKDVYGDDSKHTFLTQCRLSEILARADRLEESLALRDRIFPAVRLKFGAQHPLTQRAAGGLAESLTRLGRNEEAVPILEEMLMVSRMLRGLEHPFTLGIQSNLTSVSLKIGKQANADPLPHTQVPPPQ